MYQKPVDTNTATELPLPLGTVILKLLVIKTMA